MAEKTKIKEITFTDDSGTFNIFKRLYSSKEEYDFDSLDSLRKILTHEKAKILNTLKNKTPKSIYELAKFLKRDFKSVSDDVKLLEKFGFITLVSEKTGNRERLRPVLAITSLHIILKI